MVSGKVVIKNEKGLHMRPAGILAKSLAEYSCEINVIYEHKRIDAKSVMSLIAGCIKSGDEITVECCGTDEKEAYACAVRLIESGLGDSVSVQ